MLSVLMNLFLIYVLLFFNNKQSTEERLVVVRPAQQQQLQVIEEGAASNNTSIASSSSTNDYYPGKQQGKQQKPGGGYVRPDIMFGHVHMSKTGGTTLNGLLANKYERVCGLKGYSYDAYQANELALEKPGIVNSYDNPRDKVILFGHGIMEEIGYEDCDYVSQERRWTFWKRFSDFHDIPMELHIPCRNRIDHLMSQCNYLHQELDCDADDHDLFRAVDSCFAYLNRYSDELLNLKNINVKCYDFNKQYTTYMNYMEQFLQPRRLESKPYKRRETNLPRQKEKECIWSRPDVYKKVDEYMLEEVPYYSFCERCLGSQDDITRDEN